MKKKAVINKLCHSKDSEFRHIVAKKLENSGFRPPFAVKRVGLFSRKELGIKASRGVSGDYYFSPIPHGGGIRIISLDAKSGNICISNRVFKCNEVARKFADEVSHEVHHGHVLSPVDWVIKN